MKVQMCKFVRTEGAEEEMGVAIVDSFGWHDVDHIIDSDGERATEIWNYRLLNQPFACAQA